MDDKNKKKNQKNRITIPVQYVYFLSKKKKNPSKRINMNNNRDKTGGQRSGSNI